MGEDLTGSELRALNQSGYSGYDFSRLHDIPSCPPANAAPREGEFYAFHASDPPDAADFQTAAERSAFVGQDECQRRSNSIWSDLAKLREKIEWLKRRGNAEVYRFISRGSVKIEHGKFAPGNGPHHSFWVCGHHSMREIFTERVI